MADLRLSLRHAPRPFVVVLEAFGRQAFALQHLEQLFNRLVSGIEGLFLRFNSQLHLLQGLPQKEQLLGLSVVLGLEPPEVLLGQLDGEVLGSSAAALLLQEVVEVSLGPQLILQGLDCQLQVLQKDRRSRRGQRRGRSQWKCQTLLAAATL